MFPTVIELLGPFAKRPDIDRIVDNTKQALDKIQEEQRQRQIIRSTMTTKQPQELSEPSIDRVDKFESIGHEKGMQSSELPGGLDEDVNSEWLPSSKGMMVKEQLKCPHSRSSSKDHSKDGSKDKDQSKSKYKSSKSKERSADLEKDQSKKRRCRKCLGTDEDDISITTEDVDATIIAEVNRRDNH